MFVLLESCLPEELRTRNCLWCFSATQPKEQFRVSSLLDVSAAASVRAGTLKTKYLLDQSDS